MISAVENTIKGGIITVRCCIQHQSIRHYRKPRWVPMAKTKTYIVIENPPQPRIEFEEKTALDDMYKLYNKSLWEFQSQISRATELQERKDAFQMSEELEVERMIKLNEEHNDRVRKIREAALEEEWREKERAIIEERTKMEEIELAQLTETEKKLEKDIERLKRAIKIEDLDEAIEKALAVEYDYNYAITKTGQYLVGRHNSSEFVEGPPPDKPVVKSIGVESQ